MKKFLLLLVCVTSYGFCQQMSWVLPEVYVGNERTVEQLSGLLAVKDCPRSTLFVYPRVSFLGSHRQEGSVGVGGRFMRSNFVLGGFVFYDALHRSGHQQHTFHQISVGADAYTRRLDFRINGYFPVSRTRSFGSAAQFDGSRIMISEDGIAPLWGVDGEVGIRFRFKPCCSICPELRIYGGGYYFDRDDVRCIGGAKGRVELGLYDFIVRGSRMTVGVEAFCNDLRAGQVSGLFRWVIPFSPRSYPKSRCCVTPCCDLKLKMYERIERLGIIARRTTGSASCSGPAFFKGREISEAVVLNATQDLVTVVPSLPENALIILDGSAGEFVVTEDVNMQVGQTLVGGGSTVLLTSPACNVEMDFTLPGIPGDVVRNDDLGNVINIATNGTIQNIGIEGGFIGVSAGFPGESATDIMVLDSRFRTLNDAPNIGFVIPLVILSNSDRALIMNNEFLIDHLETTSHNGLLIADSSDAVISDNQFTGLVSNGTMISFGGTNNQFLRNTLDLDEATGMLVSVIDGLIEGNTISNAAGDGTMRLGGSTGTRIVNNVLETSPNATVNGVFFRSFNDNDVFENNEVTTLGNGTGVTVDSSTNITVRNNVLRTFGDGNAIFGPAGVFLDSGVSGITVENNDIVTQGAFGHGFRVRQANTSTFTGNTIVTNGNTARGMSIENIIDQLTFTNNTVETANTDAHGIFVNSGTNLTFNQNTVDVTGMSCGGVVLPATTNVTFSANQFTSPSGDGLNIDMATNIQVDNNAFSNIGQSVVKVTDSTINAASLNNTWDGTGGGTLCDNGGGNGGQVVFANPPDTCP